MTREELIAGLAGVIGDAMGECDDYYDREAAEAALTFIEQSGFMIVEGWKPIEAAHNRSAEKNGAERLVAELRKWAKEPQSPLLVADAADAIEHLEKSLRAFAMIYVKLKHEGVRTFRITNQRGGEWTVMVAPFAKAFDIVYGSRGGDGMTVDAVRESSEFKRSIEERSDTGRAEQLGVGLTQKTPSPPKSTDDSKEAEAH